MDPQTVFCPNQACLASGQVGQGNISVHSKVERRYKCKVCGKTFVATKGTPFYRAHKDAALIPVVITLLAYGCPQAAIVAAFVWDARTVARYATLAGQHCQAVHEHWVERPRDLGQVQADEMWVKGRGFTAWLAMALQVRTRLWLGGVVGKQRNRHLLQELLGHVRACALCRPLLFCVDGLRSYISAIQRTFREAIRTGTRGRPRLRPWDGIQIAQVVKRYQGRRVVGVLQRVVQGTGAQVQALIHATQGHGGINTAYIERLNATFRARWTPLVRRTRATSGRLATLQAGVYLVGTVYNFCTYHHSLRVKLWLPKERYHWVPRTPAMAAGITDQLWSIEKLLWFTVPQPPVLPKRRGRPSKAFLALKQRWLG